MKYIKKVREASSLTCGDCFYAENLTGPCTHKGCATGKYIFQEVTDITKEQKDMEDLQEDLALLRKVYDKTREKLLDEVWNLRNEITEARIKAGILVVHEDSIV